MNMVKNRKLRGLIWVLYLAAALAIAAWPSSAFAALGGTLDSVQADQVDMRATVKLTESSGYSVHEMKTPTGTVIREYVSSAGRVFGVTWRGPFMPDMHQLLGSYFDHYARAAKLWREAHVGRQPVNISESGLVLQSAGHMRAYFGRAYDPELLPEGVGANDVR